MRFKNDQSDVRRQYKIGNFEILSETVNKQAVRQSNQSRLGAANLIGRSRALKHPCADIPTHNTSNGRQ